MCGIVGVLAKYKAGLFKKQTDMFEQLFLVDQIRGMDGAGIIFDTKDGIRYAKAPNSAGTFMQQEVFKHSIADVVKEGHFIVGHNRAATKGSHTWRNTHPFSEGNITLVHNGTLWSHKDLDADVEVDSHAICMHMSKNGAEATLKEIDGAFALVWVDTATNTINMARNKERPLHLIECESCWVISSELGLGLWMAERNDIKVKDSFKLETETLYTFSLDDLSKYTTKEVEYMKPRPVQGIKTVAGSWWSSQFNDQDNDPVTTPFQSRRQKHLKKKQERMTAAVAGQTNVVPLTHGTPTPTRSYGSQIKFTPDRLKNENNASAIIFDESRNKSFLLGKVDGEKDTEIRVYDKWVALSEMSGHDLLEGTIIMTSIKNGRTTYELTNVHHVNTYPIDVTAAQAAALAQGTNELAIQKYCDNNGLPTHIGWLKCECCDSQTPRALVQMYNGKPFCDTCYSAFIANPDMAKQMGYC